MATTRITARLLAGLTFVVTVLAAPAGALAQAPTTFATRAAWEAAAGTVTTIDFESIAPTGAFTPFDTDLGLSRFGVRFVGRSPNNGAVPHYLRVVAPGYFPTFFDWGSGAVLHGPPRVLSNGAGGAGSLIRVTLPPDVYAVAADVMTFLPFASPASIQVTTTAGTFTYPVQTFARPTRAFVGVVSISRILSITGAADGFPVLDNFAFSANPLAPATPLNLRATATGTTVNISWDEATSGGAPTSYLMEAAQTPGGPPLGSLGTNTTSLQVASVPNGTYYVRVRAQNAVGQSPATSEVAVTVGQSGGTLTLALPAPVAIGQVATFTWQATIPAASYTVTAVSGPGVGAPVAIGATACCSLALQIPAGVAPGNYAIVVNGGGLTSAPVALVIQPAGPFTLSLSRTSARAGDVVSFSWPDLGLGPGVQYQLFAAGPASSTFAPLLPAACCGIDVSIPSVTPGVYSLFVQGSNSVQSTVVTLQITP